MPKSQAELAVEFANLKRLLIKILGEVRAADQKADINFHIDVKSVISVSAGDYLSPRWVSEEWLYDEPR